MSTAIYNHSLNFDQQAAWDKAINAGNSAYAIWTNLRVDAEYRKMAVMAVTAPTPESYNYSTGSSVKYGNTTNIIEPANIEGIYGQNNSCPYPKHLMGALKNPQLATEYGEAILFWLQNGRISMSDVGLGIGLKYQWAIENLLSVLPEGSELAGELFVFHPINFFEEYLRNLEGKTYFGGFSQSEYLIHNGSIPKKYALTVVEALIRAARLQESGTSPMPSWQHTKCVSRALVNAICDESFGAFRIRYISDLEKSQAIFQLVYDFLKDSQVPLYPSDIKSIAQRIADEEEKYAFCVRTMRNHPEFNAGLRVSRDEVLLSWLLDTARAKRDSKTAKFISPILAKTKQENSRKSLEKIQKEKADNNRQETLAALFAK